LPDLKPRLGIIFRGEAMKKYLLVSIALLMVLAFVMLFPSHAVAAPMTKSKSGIRIFNGRWESTRLSGGVETAQHLKLTCNPRKTTCRMRLIVERSSTCSSEDYDYGDPTGNMLVGRGPVIVETEPLSITINVNAYCLVRPLPDPVGPFSVTYTYNEGDDTLTDNLEIVWTRK
jgi:hypothetical protein